MGINFPEHSSEDHLIGWPGTADRGIAIAAYTSTGYSYGTPGERAYYSGRGYRIDGEEILSLSGPADPIVPGYRDGAEARYFIYGGTSGASPHVAGAAALLMQLNPALDGVGVRQALRDGALADGNVGAVPNRDWGYGKLRIHRSLYGSDAPAGGAPSIQPIDATLEVGETRTIDVSVADPEDPASSLTVDVDRDYDGSYEESVPAAGLSASYAAVGVYFSKLRVTDPTGRSGAALARFEVVEPTPPPPPSQDADLADGITAGGGACAYTAPGAGGSRGSWLYVLGLGFAAALGRARAQLSRERRKGRSAAPWAGRHERP
jgi:hypothetical protein